MHYKKKLSKFFDRRKIQSSINGQNIKNAEEMWNSYLKLLGVMVSITD